MNWLFWKKPKPPCEHEMVWWERLATQWGGTEPPNRGHSRWVKRWRRSGQQVVFSCVLCGHIEAEEEVMWGDWRLN